MKEFIDKLIRRFEEEPVLSINMGKDYLISGNAIPKERVIEIINQLAEEYINCSTDNQKLECRCKDCIHWSDMVAGATEHVKLCTVGGYMVGENGYCVYGEKRLPAPYTEGE